MNLRRVSWDIGLPCSGFEKVYYSSTTSGSQRYTRSCTFIQVVGGWQKVRMHPRKCYGNMSRGTLEKPF